MAKIKESRIIEFKRNKRRSFNITKENIIHKRLWLLEKLRDKVDKGEIRAIEIFNRILTDIKEDLRNTDDSNVEWSDILADLVEYDY